MTQQAVKTFEGESDGRLLERFAGARDEAAFAELVRRHGGMVLSVCRSVLRNSADVDDAAQAVFLTLAQKSGSPQVGERLAGWLHRVAWFVARRAAEKRATRSRLEKESAMIPPSQREGEAESPAGFEFLHAGLAELPEKYRVPIILHHLEGRSHEETARIVHCSAEAVAVRLHRGREMLRHRLLKRGVAAAVLAACFTMPAISQASPAFIESTANAAVAFTAGGKVSAAALSLSKAAIKMLAFPKLKIAGGIALAAIVVLTAALWPVSAASDSVARHAATEPASNSNLPVKAAPAPASVPVDVPVAAASDPVGPVTYITGIVVQVDADTISLNRRDGTTAIVALGPATKFTLDGNIVARSDIKPGIGAAAISAKDQLATEIRARTAATNPAPP